MNIPGVSGAVGHDACAALFVDDRLLAAVGEEHFLRDKHARGKFPLWSSCYCLESAGLQPDDIDLVAFPYAPISIFSPASWHYAQRYWYAPDRINGQIKYRERWRPFCPSMLDKVATDILQTEHPFPYMTFTFDVAESWKSRIPEVVHEDGTARAQIVTEHTNPRYYRLIEELEKRTGNAVVLNTSLNRRGEPMVYSPEDALNMFYGSDHGRCTGYQVRFLSVYFPEGTPAAGASVT